MKILIIVLLVVVLISGCVIETTKNDTTPDTITETDNGNDTANDDNTITEFCGSSTNGACDSDSDCIRAGCSGQICRSRNEEPVFSTCEWHDCYNANAYNLFCKCVDGRCKWAE